MLANATIRPNWIISGSFRNCGAPPESVMTVAIVMRADDRRRRTSRRRPRATRGRRASRHATTMRRTILYETTAIKPKFARLKATLIGALAGGEQHRGRGPGKTART